MKERLRHYRPKYVLTFLLIFASYFVSAQWVKKANALKPRSEIASVVYKNKVYVFLGFHDSQLHTESSSEVYDPATNTWKILKSLAANKTVTHQGVALIDDNVWMIGGRLGTNPGPLTSEIWIYNITKNSWSAGPQIKDPATGNPILWAAGGAVFLGRTLHVFGGFVINACNNDQETYHLTLNIDDWLSNPLQAMPWKNVLAPLPIKRNHFGTIVLGGKIYAIGGQFGHDCGGGQDQQYSHVYNPATDTWTQLPLLPSPRSHIEGGTFAIDGKIYLVAGQGTNGKDTKQVTIFNPAGNNGIGSWTDDNTLSLPASYEGISAKVINNTFIISHGGAGDSKYPKNTTYSRTLSRNPVYKLEFPSECLNLNNSSANSLKGHTWLYTIDGTKTYTTSSNATWLSVSKNATGTAIPNAVDIEVTANTNGMAPGSYSAVITASGTGSGTGYTAAALCVNLIVQQEGGPFNLSINSNGDGTTTKTPDQANYDNGTNVIITATPAPGQQFTGWSGAASGTTNPLTIVMDADKTITANFQSIASPDLITNLTTSSTRSYAIGQLKTGVNYYTDRTYYVTTVPDFLNLAPFIETPNSDKSSNALALIQFNLTQTATVYVAYDPRATALPAWLNGWEKNASTLGITDNTLTYLDLYSKVYPAGTVTLGGNLVSPAAGSLNNYIVIAVASETINQSRGISYNKIKTIVDKRDSSLPEKKDNISRLKIYPNPFHGRTLKIEAFDLPKQQHVNIIVSDILGQVYQNFKDITDDAGRLDKQINFDKILAPGIYTVKISSPSFKKLIKIIVD